MVLSDHSFAQKYVLEMEMSSSFTTPYDLWIIDFFRHLSFLCMVPIPRQVVCSICFPHNTFATLVFRHLWGTWPIGQTTLWPGSTKLPAWVVKYYKLNIEKLFYVFIIQALNLALTFVLMPQGILYYEILVSCIVNILCVVNSVKIRFSVAFLLQWDCRW